MPFIHTISYIPISSARVYIYFFRQNIKHLRSDIADIVHILAAQIPKRLRFSVRAKRMGAFFSPLNRSRWGYRSQTNKNARARTHTLIISYNIEMPSPRETIFAGAQVLFKYKQQATPQAKASKNIYRRSESSAYLRALGIRRAVCLDSFFPPSPSAVDGGALK